LIFELLIVVPFQQNFLQNTLWQIFSRLLKDENKFAKTAQIMCGFLMVFSELRAVSVGVFIVEMLHKA
jgi:hypothetical protein